MNSCIFLRIVHKKIQKAENDTSLPAMLVLTLDSSKPFRRTYYVHMLITFPRFLISIVEFRRELGHRYNKLFPSNKIPAEEGHFDGTY